MPEIRFDAVSLSSGDTVLLEPFTATLTEQRIGLIGPNGSGKSTLLRLINGLSTPTSGDVVVNGISVRRDPRSVRRAVGFIFSNADDQIIMPTVGEDVGFSLTRFRLSTDERAERIQALLERVGLDGKADQAPHTLSGGEKQLLALASVLAVEPEIIVADEPTTLLDMRNRLRLASEFATLSQQLIVATHDLELLTDFDRVLYINNGRVVADGAPPEVVDRYLADATGTADA